MRRERRKKIIIRLVVVLILLAMVGPYLIMFIAGLFSGGVPLIY